MSTSRPAKGRGSQLNPTNRFERISVEDDFEHLSGGEECWETTVKTEYFVDETKSIVSENSSPDLPFRWSINPYRGCSHGCSYCYARPTHEYLGWNAGLDFESRVMVKTHAPKLLRDWLARENWQGDLIIFSGVTDCYQPAERQFRLTRQCLAVARDAGQPIAIITKNALVTRDIDVLRPMAEINTAGVAISITTLDQSLSRVMEPRTSAPEARLRAIRELTEAGIPVHVMVAPVIPGLTDVEIPSILRAASEAGAVAASFILLRLPLTVEPVFFEWLERTQPQHKDRVESRIRATRDGKISDSKFGRRMRGEGEIAKQIAATFQVFAKKFGLDRNPQPPEKSHFVRPVPTSGQLRLFE